MKWVLRTSSVIVSNEQGQSTYRSLDDCPQSIRDELEQTIPGADSCSIMVSNREALQALRGRKVALPPKSILRTETPKSNPAPTRLRNFQLNCPRWLLHAFAALTGLAAVTALMSWAMHIG